MIIQNLKQSLDSLQPQLNAQLTETTGNIHSLRHELAEITQLLRSRPTTAPPPPPFQTETTPTLLDRYNYGELISFIISPNNKEFFLI